MEAIGLGLGVVPLIIEFLKANPGPIHAVRAIKQESAREMIEECYEDLEWELKMFKFTLSNLVSELQIGGDTKAKLLNEDGLDPTVWKNPSDELSACLRRRLDHCFEEFSRTMTKILILLSKFVKDDTLPVAVASDATVSGYSSDSSVQY